MNKRRREKKFTLAEQVKRWLESERKLPKSRPAKASNYLHHLGKYFKGHPNFKAILYCRVSTSAQKHKQNVDTQENILRRKLNKLNIPIVGCYREVSSGWVLDSEERWVLVKAVKKARKHIKNGRKTIIVAVSSDRFLRNRDFNTIEGPDILPTEAEFKKLKELACNIPLTTVLHPDMPPKEVRGWQTKWGQRVKGNKGGRPEKKEPGYKKQRRLENLSRVLRLRKRGTSWGGILALTGTPKSTAADWVKKYS